MKLFNEKKNFYAINTEQINRFSAWCYEMYCRNRDERLMFKDKPLTFDEYMVIAHTFLMEKFVKCNKED